MELKSSRSSAFLFFASAHHGIVAPRHTVYGLLLCPEHPQVKEKVGKRKEEKGGGEEQEDEKEEEGEEALGGR